MIKTRGSKGFDALFSRVFDEPGLKDAVDSLHDGFSLPNADISPRTLVTASVTETIHLTLDEIVSEIEPEDESENELEVEPENEPEDLFDGLTVGWSIKLFEDEESEPLSDEELTEEELPEEELAEDELVAEQLVEEPETQPISPPKEQMLPQSPKAKWMPLTESQGRILIYLYEIAGGLTGVDIIAKELDINSSTVRESLLVLVREGYLYLLDKKRTAGINGFTYKMNTPLCSGYETRLRESAGLAQGESLSSSIGRVDGGASCVLPDLQPAWRSPPFSSRLPDEKETITDQTVLYGAVGAYWKGEGLEESQVQKWCSQFEVEAEEMRQQLEWARFDLEFNKHRKTVGNNLTTWFYDNLRTNGGMFPRPVDYRSASELRAEAMQQHRESGLFAKAKIAEIEFANSLQSFLADPDAPLYQELLGRVNSFALEQLNAGKGKAARLELEALFKVHWSLTYNDSGTTTVSFALSGLEPAQTQSIPVNQAQICNVTADREMPLAAGWNLVGYSATSPLPVDKAITPISTLIESIWGWSSDSGKWQSYAPEREVNSLTTLAPGMGYWIKMKRGATWTLPATTSSIG